LYRRSLRKKVPSTTRKTVCDRPGGGLSLMTHLARAASTLLKGLELAEVGEKH